MAEPAQESPTYQPAMRIITAVTNTKPAAVTTSFDHDYETGLIVRILVPEDHGMWQMNGLYGPITVTGTDTFTIDINALCFDVFAVPASIKQYAQVIPIGQVSDEIFQATRNVLT